jgi:hypothetical protein
MSNWRLLVPRTPVPRELNFWLGFCQLNWSFVEFFGRLVKKKTKWLRKNANRATGKIKSLPKNATNDGFELQHRRA